MPNKFYEKGRRFENSIANKLIQSGFYVMRSAKSGGIFDLIAVFKGKIFGIQCKYDGRINGLEKHRILETARIHNITPILAYSNRRRHYFVLLDSNTEVTVKEFIRMTTEQ